jgi:hypothetical protein
LHPQDVSGLLRPGGNVRLRELEPELFRVPTGQTYRESGVDDPWIVGEPALERAQDSGPTLRRRPFLEPDLRG